MTWWPFHRQQAEQPPVPLVVQAMSQLADATDELRDAVKRVAETYPKEHRT